MTLHFWARKLQSCKITAISLSFLLIIINLLLIMFSSLNDNHKLSEIHPNAFNGIIDMTELWVLYIYLNSYIYTDL